MYKLISFLSKIMKYQTYELKKKIHVQWSQKVFAYVLIFQTFFCFIRFLYCICYYQEIKWNFFFNSSKYEIFTLLSFL